MRTSVFALALALPAVVTGCQAEEAEPLDGRGTIVVPEADPVEDVGETEPVPLDGADAVDAERADGVGVPDPDELGQ